MDVVILVTTVEIKKICEKTPFYYEKRFKKIYAVTIPAEKIVHEF